MKDVEQNRWCLWTKEKQPVPSICQGFWERQKPDSLWESAWKTLCHSESFCPGPRPTGVTLRSGWDEEMRSTTATEISAVYCRRKSVFGFVGVFLLTDLPSQVLWNPTVSPSKTYTHTHNYTLCCHFNYEVWLCVCMWINKASRYNKSTSVQTVQRGRWDESRCEWISNKPNTDSRSSRKSIRHNTRWLIHSIHFPFHSFPKQVGQGCWCVNSDRLITVLLAVKIQFYRLTA